MDDKKKKFTIPDVQIVNFNEEDIITLSGNAETALGEIGTEHTDERENY